MTKYEYLGVTSHDEEDQDGYLVRNGKNLYWVPKKDIDDSYRIVCQIKEGIVQWLVHYQCR